MTGPTPVRPLPEERPMRQAWVPRAMNASLAVFLLACISPLATRLDDRSTWLAVTLVVLCLPVLLVVALCLTSAVRPGALGRAARRSRAKRRAAKADDSSTEP